MERIITSMIEMQRIKTDKLYKKYASSVSILLKFIKNKTDGEVWTKELMCDGFMLKINGSKNECTVSDFERFTSLYKGFVTKSQFDSLCILSMNKREEMDFTKDETKICDIDF